MDKMEARLKRSWKYLIAQKIMLRNSELPQTFDPSVDTNFKYVYQLITWEFCKDMPLGDAMVWYYEHKDIIHRNLSHAILWLEDQGHPVYRKIASSKKGTTGKELEYLTLDKTYRDAKIAEEKRIRELFVTRPLNVAKKRMDLIAPRKSFEALVRNEMRELDAPKP